MEWKEAGKWVLVIAVGGAVATIFEIIITKHIQTVAAATAREEIDKVVTAAVQRVTTHAPASPPVYVASQKEQPYAVSI